jgi:hypothetical protein
LARELKSWSEEQASAPRHHVGFRCAYDVDPDEATQDE